jgi:hypothetical protein
MASSARSVGISLASAAQSAHRRVHRPASALISAALSLVGRHRRRRHGRPPILPLGLDHLRAERLTHGTDAATDRVVPSNPQVRPRIEGPIERHVQGLAQTGDADRTWMCAKVLNEDVAAERHRRPEQRDAGGWVRANWYSRSTRIGESDARVTATAGPQTSRRAIVRRPGPSGEARRRGARGGRGCGRRRGALRATKPE